MFPGFIDALSTGGSLLLDEFGWNPYDPSSFGGSYDQQHMWQQLTDIGSGFFDGGFTSAAVAGINPLLEAGDYLGQWLYPDLADQLSDGIINWADSHDLNPYG